MPNKGMLCLSVLFCFLIAAIRTQMSFVMSNYSVSPNNAKSLASQYSFSFTANNPSMGNISLTILYPNNFILSTVTGCQVKLDTTLLTGTSCTIDTTTNQISITQIVVTSTFSTITITFTTGTSRYSGTSTVEFDFINGTTSSVITTNLVLVQIGNAVMNNCTLTSNSTVVGAGVVYTVQFNPTVIIQTGSVVQLQFDSWGPYARSNFITTSTLSVCSSQCTLSLLSSFQVQLVIFSSLYSSPSNSSTTITLNSARNPSSFYPLNLKIFIIGSDGSSVYMTGNTTFTASTTNTFNGVSFAMVNKNISGTNSNINLRITPRQPINSNTYLRIIYSQYVSLVYVFGFSSLSTTPGQVNGQPVGQMLINNLTSTSITSQPTLLSMGNFTLINPPFSQKPISITFRIQQLINSTLYFVDQSTIQFTATPSTITQYGSTPQVTTIGSVTSYNLWFVTINKLIAGSYVNITFPVQTQIITSNSSLSSSSCTINNGIAGGCVVVSASLITITLSQVVNSGTNLTFTITKVTNPLLTSPSSSFTIYTYYIDDSSLVDQLTSGLTITATQTTIKSVVITPSSYVVNAIAMYTFSIQSTYSLPVGTVIKITFPQQLSIGGQILQSFTIDNIAITNCTLSSINNTQITLNTTCIPTEVKNTSTITIQIGNITNPLSFKPTDSFLVEAFNGIYRQQYIANGITVTMNQTTNVSSYIVTPNSFIANDSTLYTFDITFQIKHYSGDRVLIGLPADVLLSTVFDCVSLTTGLTISCTKYNSTTITFVLNFATPPSSSSQQSIKFTLSNLTNMWYSTTRIFTIETTTNDTIYYYQQQGQTSVNYQPAVLTAMVNNDNNIMLLGVSKLTVTLTSPYKLDRVNSNYSQFYIVVNVPIQFTPVANTCVVSNVSSVCSLISPQLYNVTSIGDISTGFTIKFNAQTTFFQNSSMFDIKLYYSTNIVQSNTALYAQRFCQLSCKQCTSTSSTCLSCLPSPYVSNTVYYSTNNTCISQCPDTYFMNLTNISCGRCSSTCLNCNNSATECISCSTGMYLFNKTCLLVCPTGYYSLNSVCLPCTNPCATCSGDSLSCLSCVSGYFIDNGSNSSNCVLTCSNNNYLGINGQCKQCTNNCKTCSITLSNCTSCDTSVYGYYQNSCVRNCPVGMYSNAIGSCANCTSPCQTCTSQLSCQSCVSGYYLFNGTTCVTQCPNGFIEVVSSCVSCASKCATCSVTVTNCTSCPSGTNYYQNDCYTNCPALTYPYNNTCTRCITPCVTCSSSPELCLSCIQGLYLLNNSCVTSCPISGYIQDSGTCSTCSQNCITCSTSINCTLCNNQFYSLLGACVSSCPINYPIVSNRQCQQCSDVCLTCDVSKDNCTSCKIGYYSYLYTCVEVCPLGYYSNVITSMCEDGLTTKIVFFPFLILTVIILIFIIVVKLIILQTSFPPSLVSLLSFTQLAVWIYMIAQLAQPIKQLNIDYALPIAMNAIALAALIGQNVGFFYLALKRMEQDQFVRGWATNNVNYTVLTIHRYVGLIINFKFFRFCYSRFFNIQTLSLPFKKNQNIFPLTTTFSIINFVLSQVPMLVCAFSLVYKKTLKDQLFYTSIQCLIITLLCAVILFIDIFKSENYFEDSDYVKTKKYLQKIKDSSMNQVQQSFDISKDDGSIDAEKFVSKTGGKFVFSKQDPSSLQDLFFQEEIGSANTDAYETLKTKVHGRNQNSPRKNAKRINIFNPIKEEDESIYEEVKYSESQIKTQAQIQIEKQNEMHKHKEQDDGIEFQQEKIKRLMQFGINTDESKWDDTLSMIEQRPLKEKWNSIIEHRQRLGRQIFNTMDEYSTKELQMIEPIQEDAYEEDERYEGPSLKEDPFGQGQNAKTKRVKRRRRKAPKQQQGNNLLQKIYLQRLSEKKSHKNIYASSQSIKYDF